MVSVGKMVLAVIVATLTVSFVIPQSAPIIYASEQTLETNADEIKSDFNGDGYQDLAIASRYEDVGSKEDAGAVSIIYGSETGLQANSPADQFWHGDSPGVDSTASAFTLFGGILESGDFNGDGYDDLAIGSHVEDIGSIDAGGGVNVLYGSAKGLQSSSPADQFWSQNSPGVQNSVEEGDHFGGYLSSADFNGDGFDDLAITAWGETVGTVFQAGAVNILYGSGNGLQASSPDDQFWNQNTSGVEDVAEDRDGLGGTTAGDFNNDGYDDLAITVTNEGIDGTVLSGAVHILYGSAGGLQTSSPSDQFWHQNSPGVDDSAEDLDAFGFIGSVRAGDFNNDGYFDLAVGAAQEDTHGLADVGVVHILYGSDAGLQTSDPADQLWEQDAAGVEDVAEADDTFGSSLG
jgi:hypothetical protein